MFSEIRYAFRSLLKSPRFAAIAILVLALGIGANSAIFSVVYHVLLKPLPYPNPEQLVMVYDTQPACSTCPASFPKYHDWQERNHVFSSIGGST